MFTEEQGTIAWNLHNKIRENEKARRKLLYDNMKHLSQMHNEKLYKAVLGDSEAPWAAYLTQHEVFYTRSKVFTYVRIYNRFIKDLGCLPQQIVDVPTTKLKILLGVVNKENVLDWLTKAEQLTMQDLEDEVRIALGKPSYLECTHNFTDYEICGKCGQRHRKTNEETANH